MLWKTHMVGGMMAGALILPYCNTDAQAVFIGCAGISALLPDIDSADSKLGRILWPLSKIFQSAIGHRGAFHSLVAAALLYLFLQIILPSYAIPISIGYLSHILLDMFNPAGVPLLWPISKHFAIPLIQTGGLLENILFVPFTACCGTLVFNILTGQGILSILL